MAISYSGMSRVPKFRDDAGYGRIHEAYSPSELQQHIRGCQMALPQDHEWNI